MLLDGGEKAMVIFSFRWQDAGHFDKARKHRKQNTAQMKNAFIRILHKFSLCRSGMSEEPVISQFSCVKQRHPDYWGLYKPHKMAEVVDEAKVLKMFLFWCKSCLNNITRCFMEFEAKRTTPVVWAEIELKFWHWMFTYWATTLYPGPLFTSKHDRSTYFMIRNQLTR